MIAVLLDEEEAEELATLLTLHCDLDPEPKVVALRQKIVQVLAIHERDRPRCPKTHH